AVLSIALNVAALNSAEFPNGRRPTGNPYRSFTILAQRFYNLAINSRVVTQFPVLPPAHPSKGADPKPPVARALQASDIAAGELLPRRWLPRGGPHAIEPSQAKFSTQPEIPIGRLRNRPNHAFGKPFAVFPCGVCVLADVESRV